MKHKNQLLLALTIVSVITITYLIIPKEKILDFKEPIALSLFLIIIIAEVIIAPIPGGAISILGAAHFGLIKAWPILYLGNIIGAITAFLLARKLGKPFIEKHVNTKKRTQYTELLHNHPKTLFLIYAIPIFPIDAITIIISLTDISFKKFLLTITLALPIYTGLTALIGMQLEKIMPTINFINIILSITLISLTIYYIKKKIRKN